MQFGKDLFKKLVDKVEAVADDITAKIDATVNASAAKTEEESGAGKVKEEKEPECAKGVCVSVGGHFYCTCCDESCPKYVENKEKYEKALDDRMIPYMKERENGDGNAVLNMTNALLPVFKQSYEHGGYDRYSDPIDYSIKKDGIGESNRLLKLAVKIKDISVPIFYSTHFIDDFIYLKNELYDLVEHDSFVQDIAKRCLKEHILDPFFEEPSLYARSSDDFAYTVFVYLVLAEEKLRSSYFYDTSKITVDLLYDENGEIKCAGRNAEIPNTIWTTIEEMTELYGREK